MCKDTTFKRILKEQEAMDEVQKGEFHDCTSRLLQEYGKIEKEEIIEKKGSTA